MQPAPPPPTQVSHPDRAFGLLADLCALDSTTGQEAALLPALVPVL